MLLNGLAYDLSRADYLMGALDMYGPDVFAGALELYRFYASPSEARAALTAEADEQKESEPYCKMTIELAERCLA
jgi:hypothetical protein